MALNSDRDGFLIADERVLISDLTQSIRGIQRSADAILVMLQARERTLTRSRIANPNSPRTRAPGSRTRGPGSPAPVPSGPQRRTRTAGQGGSGDPGTRERDGRGRYTRQPGADAAGEVRQLTRQQAQQNAERERAEESRRTREGGDQARDERGRFGAGGEGGSEDEKKSMFSRMKDFFKDRSGDALGDVDKVDPVIESANEVMGMVGGAVSALKATGELGKAVIGRGFGGQRDRATPWYKKLLQQLKLMRRDDGEFHRAELRALNEQQGGDGGSFIGSILKLLFGPVGAALVGAAVLAWTMMGDKISGAWNGFIASVKEKWDSAVKTFLGIWEPIAKFFSDKFGIVTNAVSGAAEAANTAIKGTTGVDVKETAAKVADATARAAGAVTQTVGDGLTAVKDWGSDKIASLISAKGTSRVYGRQDGAVERRDGGSVSWRNNNPGNLKFAYADSADKTDKSKRTKDQALAAAQKAYGAAVVDLDQWGNAVFSTEEAGRAAQAQLLKKKHGEKTVEQMLPKYAISDYSGKANIPAYANGIHKAAEASGVNLRGKKIGEMSDVELNTLLDGMRKVEGFKVGSTKIDAAAPAPQASSPVAALGPQASSTARGPQAPGAAAAPAPQARAGETAQQQASRVAAALMPLAPSTATAIAPLAWSAAPAVSASGPPRVPSITIPSQVSPPTAARADVPMPLSSKPPIEVRVSSDKMAGQDVRDRRLAHIATGGMAS